MTQLEEYRKEIEPHKNTLVLDLFKVVRLIDIIQEPDDLYCKMDSREGVYLTSCVGWFKPLKGVLSDKDYNYLVRIWNLNNVVSAI